MSEVKFPPRVCLARPKIGSKTWARPLSEKIDGHDLEYLSLQEHNHLLSQLEERLLLATYFIESMDCAFPEIDKERHLKLCRRCMALAAIKEKK